MPTKKCSASRPSSPKAGLSACCVAMASTLSKSASISSSHTIKERSNAENDFEHTAENDFEYTLERRSACGCSSLCMVWNRIRAKQAMVTLNANHGHD